MNVLTGWIANECMHAFICIGDMVPGVEGDIDCAPRVGPHTGTMKRVRKRQKRALLAGFRVYSCYLSREAGRIRPYGGGQR